MHQGQDVTLITAGICTEEALRAIAILGGKGVSIHHLHVSTHKPFTNPVILEAVSKPRYGVITLENHSIWGGLGTEVAEVMATNGVGKRLVRVGLRDSFAHGGSRPYLMRKLKIDAMALVLHIEEMIGMRLGIREEDLERVRIEPFDNIARVEAL